MCLAGGFRERRGHDNDVDLFHRAIEFRKTQVVTNRQPNAAEGRLQRLHGAARLDGALLGIILVAHVKTKQMDLVIARNLLALIIINETAVTDFLRIIAGQRYRSTDDPDLVCARGIRQKLLDRPLALGLTHFDLVGLLHAHDGEIFGQSDQTRALRRRHRDQATGFVQIRRNLGPRGHLHTGDACATSGQRCRCSFLRPRTVE